MDWLGAEVPIQCDGFSLLPFLTAEAPQTVPPLVWRSEAHWEYDWRTTLIDTISHEWPWDRVLERQHLTVTRTDSHAYVQFGNGDWLCFDLATDPTWRTETHDPAVVLPLAQELLIWRSQHANRLLADLVLGAQGAGRWPPVPWRN